jgi:hypothetical protein
MPPQNRKFVFGVASHHIQQVKVTAWIPEPHRAKGLMFLSPTLFMPRYYNITQGRKNRPRGKSSSRPSAVCSFCVFPIPPSHTFRDLSESHIQCFPASGTVGWPHPHLPNDTPIPIMLLELYTDFLPTTKVSPRPKWK